MSTTLVTESAVVRIRSPSSPLGSSKFLKMASSPCVRVTCTLFRIGLESVRVPSSEDLETLAVLAVR